jgi:hypothetical protein
MLEFLFMTVAPHLNWAKLAEPQITRLFDHARHMAVPVPSSAMRGHQDLNSR